ncbi:MAG: Kelch repeat-containing protein [Puniceicoccaceae bacterium]
MRTLTLISLILVTSQLVLAENQDHTCTGISGWELEDVTGCMHPRHEATFVECEGKFYLLGGRRIQPVDAYDPGTGEWEALAAPPIELHHFQAISREGKIWVIGAMTGKYPNETPVPHMYIFEPGKNEWTVGPEIPVERRRSGGGVVEHEGMIYLVAGIQRGHMGGFVPWLDRWNPTTGEWEVLPDAPHARDHFQAVIIEGKIYSAGGRQTSRETDELFSRTVAEVDVYDIASGGWATLELPLPTPRAGTSSAVVDGCLLVAGGESGTQKLAHDEVEVYSPESGEWYDWPALQRGRHGSAVINYKGKLYTCSGSGNRGGRPELSSIESLVLGKKAD